jgi:hypothetical protein
LCNKPEDLWVKTIKILEGVLFRLPNSRETFTFISRTLHVHVSGSLRREKYPKTLSFSLCLDNSTHSLIFSDDKRPKATIALTRQAAATCHAILSHSQMLHVQQNFPHHAQPEERRKRSQKTKRVGDSHKKLRRRKDHHKSQLEFQFGFYRGTESIVSSSNLLFCEDFLSSKKKLIQKTNSFEFFSISTVRGVRVSVNRKVYAIKDGRKENTLTRRRKNYEKVLCEK